MLQGAPSCRPRCSVSLAALSRPPQHDEGCGTVNCGQGGDRWSSCPKSLKRLKGLPLSAWPSQLILQRAAQVGLELYMGPREKGHKATNFLSYLSPKNCSMYIPLLLKENHCRSAVLQFMLFCELTANCTLESCLAVWKSTHLHSSQPQVMSLVGSWRAAGISAAQGPAWGLVTSVKVEKWPGDTLGVVCKGCAMSAYQKWKAEQRISTQAAHVSLTAAEHFAAVGFS